MSENAVVTLVKEGEDVEYRGRRGSAKRTLRVNREWHVTIDGEFAGRIQYLMLTRETRSEGRVYVNDRWTSPGWRYSFTADGRGFEVPSRRQGVALIVQEWEYANAQTAQATTESSLQEEIVEPPTLEEAASAAAAAAYPETEWSTHATINAFRAAFEQGYLKAWTLRGEADRAAVANLPIETDLDEYRKPDVIWQGDAEQAIRGLDTRVGRRG